MCLSMYPWSPCDVVSLDPHLYGVVYLCLHLCDAVSLSHLLCRNPVVDLVVVSVLFGCFLLGRLFLVILIARGCHLLVVHPVLFACPDHSHGLDLLDSHHDYHLVVLAGS